LIAVTSQEVTDGQARLGVEG